MVTNIGLNLSQQYRLIAYKHFIMAKNVSNELLSKKRKVLQATNVQAKVVFTDSGKKISDQSTEYNLSSLQRVKAV